MMSSMKQSTQSERNGSGPKDRIMKRANDALGRGIEGYGIANAVASHSALESQNAKRPCPAESFGNEQSPDRPTHAKKPPVTIHGGIHGVFERKNPLPSVPQSAPWIIGPVT
jgi:hypothetical protein